MRNIGDTLLSFYKREAENKKNSDWKFAKLIYVLYKKELYSDMGYDSFRDFVEFEIGIPIRKAQYLCCICEWFEQFPEDAQEWIVSLPWYLACQASFCMSPENWVDFKKTYDTDGKVELLYRIRRARVDADSDEEDPDRPIWIVNDSAELGVMVHGKPYFCYKGDSLVYKSGKHDNGERILYREIGKREFGECVHPIKYDRNAEEGEYVVVGDDWKQLPISEE